MDGKFHKLSNGHNSFDIYKAPADFLINITDILIKRFEVTLISPQPMSGLDGSYLEFKRGNIRITAGWDVWSGCFIQSYCANGDELVLDIGNYLNTLNCKFGKE